MDDNISSSLGTNFLLVLSYLSGFVLQLIKKFGYDLNHYVQFCCLKNQNVKKKFLTNPVKIVVNEDSFI